MKALTRKQLFVLRATIKGFAAESKLIRKKHIKPTQGAERAEGWNTKRTLGYYARLHLLAYALLRGRKREDLEKGSKDSEWLLSTYAEKIYDICRQYGTYRVYWYREFTKEAVLAWLKGGDNVLFTKREPNKVILSGTARLKKPVGKAS